MPRRVFAIAIAIILTISAIAAAKGNRQVRATRIDNLKAGDLRVRNSLATADTCTAQNDEGLFWLINGWVIGQELYKRYIDPSDSCTFPYNIYEIGMPLYFARPTQITVAIDVEAADLTDPTCPVPGKLIDTSSLWTIDIPDAGIWNIFIPLNTPLTVNEPFFAGFYIANPTDPADSVAVITDEASTQKCWSFNMWDTTGFYDLRDTIYFSDSTYFIFPGRLIMYATNFPTSGGGGGNQPPPAVRFVSHRDDAHITGRTELWAQDTSGSAIIDYVTFSYYKVGDTAIEIGRDYDGFSPLRNGLDGAPPGDGFSIIWDPSGVPAGFYSMEVTAFDSLGRASTDKILRVVLEPTRPTPNITSPVAGSDFCNTLDFIISPGSPDITTVQFFEQPALLNYSLGLTGVAAPTVPDAGPAAAASIIKYWNDNGYPNLMTDINTLVSDLTVLFRTNKNSGTYDGDLFAGLYNYQFSHGKNLNVEFMKNPDYFDIRTWTESEQRTVLLGIGGSKGTWLAVNGFDSWPLGSNPFFISVMLPTTGTVMDLPIRNTFTTTEIKLYGVWERVDIMVSLVPSAHTVSRTTIGLDINGSDGWGLNYTPSGLSEDNLYFYRAEGTNGSTTDASTVLLNYNCSAVFVVGDFNSDGTTNIADYNVLQSFIAFKGAPPTGGGHRADTNCDQTINLADLVFYANFLFGTASPPCW